MAETVDIQAFQYEGSNPAVQALATPQSSGTTVSGPAKIAQRYATSLLTVKGSVPYLPKLGSAFMNRLKYGGVANENDVLVAFASAQTDVAPYMRSLQSDSDPTDEQFVRAALTQIRVAFGFVTLAVQVFTADGSSTVILLPLVFHVQ